MILILQSGTATLGTIRRLLFPNFEAAVQLGSQEIRFILEPVSVGLAESKMTHLRIIQDEHFLKGRLNKFE